MGKEGAEWVQGRKCNHCRYFESEAKKKTDRIGICKRFSIDVIDCLCGCRPGERGGTVLMNFGDEILDKIKTEDEETDDLEEKEDFNMQSKEMNEERMRAFCKDAIPVLEKLQMVAKENGVTGSATIYMSQESFSIGGSGFDGWEMNNYGGKYRMKHERTALVFEEEADAE